MIRRAKLFRLTNGRCWYCGQAADNRDHVIPRSKGGSNKHINLVPSCRACNDMKSDLTLEEFRQNLRDRWAHAQTNRRAMKRPVALIGAVSFRFYFEIAGLAQPVIPAEALSDIKPPGYSLSGVPTYAFALPSLPTGQPVILGRR